MRSPVDFSTRSTIWVLNEIFSLWLAGLAGEQPIGVAAAHQRRAEVVHVLVDDRRDDLIELELERRPCS